VVIRNFRKLTHKKNKQEMMRGKQLIMDDHKILGIKNENRMEKFQKMKKKQIICNSSGA